jgi:hypothetical protein
MKITDKSYFDQYFELIGSEIDLLLGNYNFSDDKVDLSTPFLIMLINALRN